MLPSLSTGIELRVLFRYLTAFQKFFALRGLIVLKNLDLAPRSCETTLFRIRLYVQFIYFAFFPSYTFTGPKIGPPLLRCQQGNHELCSVHEPRDNPERVASVQEETQLNLDDQC